MKDKLKQLELSMASPAPKVRRTPFWKGGQIKGKRYFRQHHRWGGGNYRYAELDLITKEVYRVRRKDAHRMWRVYSYNYDPETGVERLLNRLMTSRWEEIQPDWLRVDEGL